MGAKRLARHLRLSIFEPLLLEMKLVDLSMQLSAHCAFCTSVLVKLL
jgi:hypothetical protein